MQKKSKRRGRAKRLERHGRCCATSFIPCWFGDEDAVGWRRRLGECIELNWVLGATESKFDRWAQTKSIPGWQRGWPSNPFTNELRCIHGKFGCKRAMIRYSAAQPN